MTSFRRRNPVGELLAGRVAVGRLAKDAKRLQDSADVNSDGTNIQTGRARSGDHASSTESPRRG